MTDALVDEFAEVALSDDLDEAPVTLAGKMRAAKDAAFLPKPKLPEMIEAVSIIRMEIEGGQTKLIAEGDREQPDAPTMRRAAMLAHIANFLTVCDECRADIGPILKRKMGK